MDNTIVKSITSQGIDKTAIKNFAVYARNKLIKDIKNKAAMIGVTESGIQEPLSTSTGNIQLFDIGMQESYHIKGKAIAQRNGLIRELKKREQGSTYLTAYQTLIEEVAYTWFNRIIAIRFMEVNKYMPDRMSVLSSGVEGINEPEFIRHVFETSFQFSKEEKKHIIELKTDGSNLAMGELFQYLFIKQCNALNANLPELFERTNDYTELLLTVSYNDIEGVIYKLVHDVPEANFDVNSESGNGQVEIIGWLYQFYNTEPKATVFSRPKSKKIEKQDIPAVTQLFTPEWIVKYMVENSLGRLWIEKLLANGDYRTEKKIADDFSWKYYLTEAKQEDKVQKQLENLRNERKNLSIENINFLDPAMGSFHIGIYAFDVFMQLYESDGYTTREAARLIVEKNLYGLDIDKRASQLSYFACMMQARKYNRRILEKNLQPNVYEVPESDHINRQHLNYLGNNIEDTEEWNRLKLQLDSLLNDFTDTKEYGSLINISNKYDFFHLRVFVMSHSVDSQISLLETVGLEETQKELINIINVADIISKKYNVVITNPPYMSSSVMDKKLSNFAKKYYPDSKSDMFAMFIEKCRNYTVKNGYFSMITQHAWMFLSSYEKLRINLLKNSIVNMAHLGTRAFDEIGGEIVQTTSFVYLNNYSPNYRGIYIKLTKFNSQAEKEAAYLSVFDVVKKSYVYENHQENFKEIPGKVIAYWASDKMINIFSYPKIGSITFSDGQILTGDNNQFLRYIWEINYTKIHEDWMLHAKGGSFRKWFGNLEYVVKWTPDAISHYKRDRIARFPKDEILFRKGITWSLISTHPVFGSRILNKNETFNKAAATILFKDENEIEYILGLLNSKIGTNIMEILNPTLNNNIKDVLAIPYIHSNEYESEVKELIKENIDIAKTDWNLFETAWDFKNHPLLKKNSETNMKNAFIEFKENTNRVFLKIKQNEEQLNKCFMEIYGLSKEITPDVDEKNVTVTRVVNSKNDLKYKSNTVLDKIGVIKTFISYAVGCILGRYSLGENGIAYAGGEFYKDNYTKFKPMEDNIAPVLEQGSSQGDIMSKFVEFVAKCYGEEHLENNLLFIANALGNKKISSREVIRDYFINDFYRDHLKTYQKRPIYWLYDSGKQNGFKALVYMHRYDEDTTGKVRVGYLHQVQRSYERMIANLQEDIANSKNTKETIQLQKQLEKIIKQLKECRDYDERLGHMALERIAIDLDDGVKVNYEKVQTDNKGKFHQILAKIK